MVWKSRPRSFSWIGIMREIGFRQRLGNVHHALGRVAADQIEPMRQIAARFKPGPFADRRRNRIAVENRKNDR